MKYLDWCDAVWLAVGKLYDSDKPGAMYGMNTGALAERLGFGDAATQPDYLGGPLFEAVMDALTDLQAMTLVHDVGQWNFKLSDRGRKGRGLSLRTSWRQIHREVTLEDDETTEFMRRAVDLGEIEDEAHARHKWLTATDLFDALGWPWDMRRAVYITNSLETEGCIAASTTLGQVQFHNTYVGLVKLTTSAGRAFEKRDGKPGEPSVFMCYAHEDADAAREIALGLQDDGVHVWFDEGELRGGDSLIERVAEAAYGADFLLALVTEFSVESNWCRKEIAIAMTGELANRGVRVIPLRIGDVSMPPSLVDKVYRNVDPAAPSAVVDQLLRDIRSHRQADKDIGLH